MQAVSTVNRLATLAGLECLAILPDHRELKFTELKGKDFTWSYSVSPALKITRNQTKQLNLHS